MSRAHTQAANSSRQCAHFAQERQGLASPRVNRAFELSVPPGESRADRPPYLTLSSSKNYGVVVAQNIEHVTRIRQIRETGSFVQPFCEAPRVAGRAGLLAVTLCFLFRPSRFVFWRPT